MASAHDELESRRRSGQIMCVSVRAALLCSAAGLKCHANANKAAVIPTRACSGARESSANTNGVLWLLVALECLLCIASNNNFGRQRKTVLFWREPTLIGSVFYQS